MTVWLDASVALKRTCNIKTSVPTALHWKAGKKMNVKGYKIMCNNKHKFNFNPFKVKIHQIIFWTIDVKATIMVKASWPLWRNCSLTDYIQREPSCTSGLFLSGYITDIHTIQHIWTVRLSKWCLFLHSHQTLSSTTPLLFGLLIFLYFILDANHAKAILSEWDIASCQTQRRHQVKWM